MKTKFISEIGINHNGSMELEKKLITESYKAGCQYVKIQKRKTYFPRRPVVQIDVSKDMYDNIKAELLK